MDKKWKMGLLIGGIVLATGLSIYFTVTLIWPMLNGEQEQEQVVNQGKNVDSSSESVSDESTGQAEKKGENKSENNKPPEKMGKIYEIENLTVNTHGSGGLRFAVFKLALETEESDVISELEQREPILRDWLIDYYRKKSVGSLLDPAFQDSSKTVIKRSINKKLTKGTIDSVYYLKLVIQ